MAEKSPENRALKDRTEPSKVPALDHRILILPVSNTEFHARWSLSHDSENRDMEAASLGEAGSHLALRAFYLPAGSDDGEYSKVWYDFSISGIKGSGHFKLPKPAVKINAVVGLLNKSGNFSPLIRGKAVELPPEAGLKPEPGPVLKDEELLNLVQHHLAPNPFQPIMDTASGTAKQVFGTEEAGNSPTASGSAAQDRSKAEAGKSDKAPIEIRVLFTIRGKVASGMKLMLGNEIMEPDRKGFFHWEKELNSFTQVWPLLYAALLSPSVPAAPSLRFFKNVDSSKRLLELQATLEIKGKVNDPDYGNRLPSGLEVDAEGQFHLTRMLPEGAVILPGLSLIAS